MATFDDRFDLRLDTDSGRVCGLGIELDQPQEWEVDFLMYVCDVLRQVNRRDMVNNKLINNDSELPRVLEVMEESFEYIKNTPYNSAPYIYYLGLMCAALYTIQPIVPGQKSDTANRMFDIKEIILTHGMTAQ